MRADFAPHSFWNSLRHLDLKPSILAHFLAEKSSWTKMICSMCHYCHSVMACLNKNARIASSWGKHGKQRHRRPNNGKRRWTIPLGSRRIWRSTPKQERNVKERNEGRIIHLNLNQPPWKTHRKVELPVTTKQWKSPCISSKRPESHLSAEPRSSDWVCDGWAEPSQPSAHQAHPGRGPSWWVTTPCPI